MRFREIHRIPQRLQLNENKAQYRQMMQSLVTAGFLNDSQAKQIVDEARTTLKRNDRVVWWLKHYKVYVIEQDPYGTEATRNKIQELQDQGLTGREFEKAIDKWMERASGWKYEPNVGNQFSIYFLRNKDHIESMFDLSAEYNEVIWSVDKTPAQLYHELEDAEARWGDKRKKWVVPEEFDKILLTYKNGEYAWVKLNREYCRAEGNAMGHCGNTASWRPGDRILSFRTIREKSQKPHLTFILDDNGFLGEMKGRANTKPDAKYHPYIVDLLKQPFVKGIKGGGYAPEDNFSIDDLSESDRLSLLQAKPSLGGPIYMFLNNDRIYSPQTGYALRDVLEETVGFKNFNINTGKITIKTFSDVESIGDELEDRNLEMVGDYDVFGGSRYYDIGDVSQITSEAANNLESVEELIGEMTIQEFNILRGYLNFIGDELDDDSIAAVRDRIGELIEEGDEVADAILSGIVTGYRTGSESEMVSYVIDHLTENGFEQSPDGSWIWSMNAQALLERLSYEVTNDSNESLIEELSNLRWRDLVNYQKMDLPRYGWDGYDVKAAVERTIDSLYEIPEYRDFAENTYQD